MRNFFFVISKSFMHSFNYFIPKIVKIGIISMVLGC